MTRKRNTRGRKLLIATAGLATVMYVACKEQAQPPGNLVAPPPTEMPPGNLPAPPPIEEDAGAPEQPDAGDPQPDGSATTQPSATAKPTATIAAPEAPPRPPVGNLVAPPPVQPPIAPKGK